MKTKLLLTAALIGVASLSAQAGVFVGFSVGLPAPRVVVTAPAPVLVAPVAPIVETVPVCPGPGYVWVPGYWSGYGQARAWVAGCWRAPVRVAYAHPDRDRGHVDRGHADRGDHGDHGYGPRR